MRVQHAHQTPACVRARERREVVIPVRWTASEAAWLDIAAAQKGLTVSAYLRQLAADQRAVCEAERARARRLAG